MSKNFILVPGVGLEPTRTYGPTDFKSVVSTTSTIQAFRKEHYKDK